MNLSMWIRLLVMNSKGSLKISNHYKYRDYMFGKNWIEPLEWIESKDGAFSTRKPGAKVEITEVGREALFAFDWKLIPILISLLALIISAIALLVALR